MKSLFRIILASIIIIVVFNMLDWCLNKILLWIVDWSLIGFIAACIIANSVLVYVAHIIVAFVGVIISYSKTYKQFLAIKWVLLFVSWGMAILTFLIIFKSADFSMTKICIFGILVFLLNISIPIFVNRMIKSRYGNYIKEDEQFNPTEQKIMQQLSEYGYDTTEIYMKIVSLIKEGKSTYPDSIVHVKGLKESGVINEHQEVLIINMVKSHISKKTTD